MKRWIVTAGFSLVTVAALAHSGATGIVKERMDLMGGVGKATKEIGKMLKGEAAYDSDRVAELARAIAASGGRKMTALFPEGSIMGPSEARPEIWTNWQRFSDIAGDLTATATALADGAANSRDGSKGSPEALFGAMAKTCKGCHQDFRIKK